MNRNSIAPTTTIERSVDQELGAIAVKIRGLSRRGLDDAIQMGELLHAAKNRCIDAGQEWFDWLAKNTPVSKRTSQRNMFLAEHKEEIKDCESITHALKRLEHISYQPSPPRARVACAGQEESHIDAASPSAALLNRLPFDGRNALESGLITEAAAQHLLRLRIYDRLATTPHPFANWPLLHESVQEIDQEVEGSHSSWANHMAKLIIWRPHCAHTEDEIAIEVDSAILDLWEVMARYASLPKEEADELARKKLLNPDPDDVIMEGFSPEYWHAKLWIDMEPDYSRLSDADALMLKDGIKAFFRRVCGLSEEEFSMEEMDGMNVSRVIDDATEINVLLARSNEATKKRWRRMVQDKSRVSTGESAETGNSQTRPQSIATVDCPTLR
jgi:hypothetical protein